jgi:hypothetical protein
MVNRQVRPNWRRRVDRPSRSWQTRGLRRACNIFFAAAEQNRGGAPLSIGAVYFMRPAAVSARVMTLPTSIARRRGD